MRSKPKKGAKKRAPQKGRTRAARATEKPKPKTVDRMIAVERMLVEGLKARHIAREKSVEWGISEAQVLNIIHKVELLWVEEGQSERKRFRASAEARILAMINSAYHSTKPQRRTKKVKRGTDERGEPVYEHITVTEVVHAPDHRAIARYQDMLNRFHGLYRDKVEVEHTGGLIDAIRLGAARDVMRDKAS